MKGSAESGEPRDFRSGLGRHLEGWQAGAVALGLAVTASLLVVPRRAPPSELPLPAVDRSEQRRDADDLARLAHSVMNDGLPFTVRAVGEQVRRFGTAAAQRSDLQPEALQALRAMVAQAREKHGDPPLLSLRAVQTRFFVLALRGSLEAGKSTRELTELAADWFDLAKSRGWIDDRGLNVPEADMTTSFLVRWTALCGLLGARAFAPSLNQWRAYYRTRLAYPGVEGATPLDLQALGADVEALAERDPDYPASIARGVLAYRNGNPPQAARAFLGHLSRHDHGPFTLRVRNYLAAAVDVTP